MLVLTFPLNGGLNQIIFLRLFFFFDLVVFAVLAWIPGLNFRVYAWPLLRSASWYCSAASLNASSSQEISESLLLIASGMFRIMLGGWLDLLCMYRGVVAGFENGLNLPVVRSRVTSRKLTIFLFASMVIRRLFWANILHISFLIFSIYWGVWLILRGRRHGKGRCRFQVFSWRLWLLQEIVTGIAYK